MFGSSGGLHTKIPWNILDEVQSATILRKKIAKTPGSAEVTKAVDSKFWGFSRLFLDAFRAVDFHSLVVSFLFSSFESFILVHFL